MVLAMKKMKIALMKSAKKPTKVKKGTLKETHVVTNIRFAQQCSLSPPSTRLTTNNSLAITRGHEEARCRGGGLR